MILTVVVGYFHVESITTFILGSIAMIFFFDRIRVGHVLFFDLLVCVYAMKVVIEVVLPTGEKMKGEVESSAPVAQIKEEIINALLKNESPENYDLVLLPKDGRSSFSNYTLKPNDILLILPKNKTSGLVFRALT
jgi:hypothetical protein